MADIVFDNLAKYASVLFLGRTISFHLKRADIVPVNMRHLWAKEAAIQCFSRYSYPDSWSFAQKQMMELCRNGAIFNSHQVIEGFEKTPIALRDMLKGKYQGKVLVRYAHATSSVG